jgi:hypothetical protein
MFPQGCRRLSLTSGNQRKPPVHEILAPPPPVLGNSVPNVSRGPPLASPLSGGGLIKGKQRVAFQPTTAGLASESRTRSDDGHLAALRRAAFQRLLDHAKGAIPFGGRRVRFRDRGIG